MKPLSVGEVIGAVQGACDRLASTGSITRVVTDSRELQPGDLFVAIQGERFDGHAFIGPAFAAGAIAALVRSDYDPAKYQQPGSPVVPPNATLIRVPDPVQGLGRLARYYRRSVIGRSTTVVAITGSNGKTTTKSMCAHVLSGRFKGKGSIKSFNNAIGVPLTILSADPSDDFLICEVGTNAPGEIATLARMFEPDLAVITNVAPAHLEKLGTVEGVAEEKLSLLSYLQPNGCAVINTDHERVRWMLQNDRRFRSIKRVTCGESPDADLRLTSVRTLSPPLATRDAQLQPSGPRQGSSTTQFIAATEFTVNDRFKYRLNVPGRHNAMNALAAIGVARRFGMNDDEIAERLASFSLPAMRLEVERLGRLTVINDAYNANPASLLAAVEALMDTPAAGRRVLVIGDMRELGLTAEVLHREAAERIAQSGVDLVIAIGEHAKLVARTVQSIAGESTKSHAYASTALAKRRLCSHLQPTDTVLVKGSRVLGLEALVQAVREWSTRRSPSIRAPKRGRRRQLVAGR